MKQPPDLHMHPVAGDDFTVRVSAQFYPSGEGWMQEHEDPKGDHQVALASVIMSRKGQHFTTGGMYTRDASGRKVFPEDDLEPGDIFWFIPQTSHGVELIDADHNASQNSYDGVNGRWIVLCATNSLASGTRSVSARPIM